MADVGDVGPELQVLVRHARDHYDLLREQLIAAEPDAAEDVGGMCDAMGNRLGQLGAILDNESRLSIVH